MSDRLWCRHPDCEGSKIISFTSMENRDVHMKEVHHKKKNPIQDPNQLLKEIIKFKKKLHNKKWRGDKDKTYTILYTTPKRKKVKIMRKELLKEIYDLQDDLEWICNSHYLLYRDGGKDEGPSDIFFPEEINDLDKNNSMYWNFLLEPSQKTVWLDLVVSPIHQNPTDVSQGFCYAMVDGEFVNLEVEYEEEAWTCFNRLLRCMMESYNQLEIIEKYLKKLFDSKKLATFTYAYKNAVDRGDPFDELDETVHEKIAYHVRNF